MIKHFNPQRHMPIHRMHRTRKTRIISPHDHFDAVFDLLVEFAVFDVALGEGLDAEVHAWVVADGADDEVDVGEDAVGVGGVVVDEESSGGFEDTDAASAFDFVVSHDVVAGDGGVGEDFFGAFDGVEDFDHAGVVVEEGVVGGVAELGAELGEFVVGFGGSNFVSDVEASEGSDAVDAFGPAVGEVEGEFEVGVVFYVFADVFEVVFDGEFGKVFEELESSKNSSEETKKQLEDALNNNKELTRKSQLIDAKDRLGNLIKEKNLTEKQNKFVADASHELRTPLAVMQGYIDILDSWGKNDPKVLDESVLSMKNEVFSMKHLIEKLLFLARGESGKIKLNKSIIQLNHLIEKIVRDTEIITENHQILSDRNDELEIEVDEQLILQAIRALIDNSIKYTPENGEIIINSTNLAEVAKIEIIDNGIGVDKEDISKVFNRFYRVDESRNKKTGGNGLGLSIVKKIIELHNGSVKIESEKGKGTTITIFLRKQMLM